MEPTALIVVQTLFPKIVGHAATMTSMTTKITLHTADGVKMDMHSTTSRIFAALYAIFPIAKSAVIINWQLKLNNCAFVHGIHSEL